MHPHNWISQIDQTTEDFRRSFGSLTHEQLNWRPNNQTWSIGQNIDHLIVINRTYFPIVHSLHNGSYKAPFMGKLGFMVSFIGKMLLKSVQPDTKRKTKTFPLWEPSQGSVPADILDKFARHQEELKKLITDSADFVQKGAVISSPANRNIVYKLSAAFDIIVTHEQRHFQQAKEIQKMLYGRSSKPISTK